MCRPAPVVLSITSKPASIKPGESADIEVKVERQGKFAGLVTLTLVAPDVAKLRADPTTIKAGAGSGKLAVADDERVARGTGCRPRVSAARSSSMV